MTSDPTVRHMPRRKGKRARKDSLSLDGIVVEEMSPGDIGYDADIEVIHPSRYEEMDSESEADSVLGKRICTLDEELAERMRALGRERNTLRQPASTNGERGRKRRSKEMDDYGGILDSPMSPGLEVHEMLDTPSPAKRRRKKSRRPNAAQHILPGYNGTRTDSSDRMDAHNASPRRDSVSSTATSDVPLGSEKHDEDGAMDVS